MTLAREFPGGEFGVSAAFIIGTRSERTDDKVQLMKAAREFGVEF